MPNDLHFDGKELLLEGLGTDFRLKKLENRKICAS